MQDRLNRLTYESNFLVLPLAYGQKFRKDAGCRPLFTLALLIKNEGLAALHYIP